ncbi:MAG TPA: hypothetical protein VMY37_02100 [Thermoguttaceae bacterium]|nr:hypothetical protein [Thermoguttaceae bacterium]
MSWFESQSTKEKKSTVKNVIAVMLADGKITSEEQEFLAAVCVRVGLSPAELKSILDDPQKVSFTPAKAPKERIMQLLDVVFMMMIDGEVDQREMRLCQAIATQLGFPASAVPKLVMAIIEGIKKGRERATVASEIEGLLD